MNTSEVRLFGREVGVFERWTGWDAETEETEDATEDGRGGPPVVTSAGRAGGSRGRRTVLGRVVGLDGVRQAATDIVRVGGRVRRVRARVRRCRARSGARGRNARAPAWGGDRREARTSWGGHCRGQRRRTRRALDSSAHVHHATAPSPATDRQSPKSFTVRPHRLKISSTSSSATSTPTHHVALLQTSRRLRLRHRVVRG